MTCSCSPEMESSILPILRSAAKRAISPESVTTGAPFSSARTRISRNFTCSGLICNALKTASFAQKRSSKYRIGSVRVSASRRSCSENAAARKGSPSRRVRSFSLPRLSRSTPIPNMLTVPRKAPVQNQSLRRPSPCGGTSCTESPRQTRLPKTW